ncbi:MAG TPA: alpha/beta hydrolase, partial [Frankiaceae bacterium]|nr:alpha/beta hydrolase [Frankiaceae bacterium]
MDLIEARGLRFPARAAGPADGRLVLLLHGFPQTSHEWRAQLAALGGAGYRAVAFDQRGYAPTARPARVEAYRMDELVADTLAVADALGAGVFDVVGHDWGGVVAWHLGGRHADRLRTLTVVSTPHPMAHARALRSGGEQARMSSYFALFRQEGRAEDVLLADDARRLRSLFGGSAAAGGPYVELMRDRAALTGGLSWYRASSYRDTEKVGRIRVPTLYVWGADDPV